MMKLMVLGTLLVTLIGEANMVIEPIETTNEIITEVEVEEEVSLRELVDDNYLNYSKEYIDELYYNSIGYITTQNEWEKLEDLGLTETEIEYVLLKKYGEIR